MFSPEEIVQYSRQIQLENFGLSAQEKLKSAKVLVIGAGALGCPVLQYLVAAGVGKIGIVDGDKIERSNLHRQILYRQADIGKSKAETAKIALQNLNPFVEIEVYCSFFTKENAMEITKKYDVLVDGTDNFSTRYLVNDVCVLTGKTNVHGSIQQFVGQIAVFNWLAKNGQRTPNYRDLYPQPPKPEDVVSCAEGGVIGALPGVIGSIMAMETVKCIAEMNDILGGQLFQYNSLTFSSSTLNFGFDEENPLRGNPPLQTELIDYDQFCGIPKTKKMKEITVQELKKWRDESMDFQLVDVREKHEYGQGNLGGILIPLAELPNRYTEISKEKKVVIQCKSGGRSARAIEYLEQNYGYENLFNLKGGIIAWMMEIDSNLKAKK